ncbi:MAG: 30S ribosomal protein S12 methylthiotransferase RimO [Desulfobacterales bacterium]|jgi:ribosomal protein S12 methylthiotransferase|nr:30S ribosomal protein S12 methylthiotransferase RimO [Desulfobacterales bacterium]
MKLHLVSLGCARNQVDSEMMLGRLQARGWAITDAPEAAEVIIVNTCSFIEPAANESIDTILALAAFKRTGACRKLIVTGCLPERYREEIAESLPEVDLFLGTGAYEQIETAVQDTLRPGMCLLPDPNRTELTTAHLPRVTTDAHTAYLKIAEGCDSRCTYCIIPALRGNHRSRPVEDLIAEARTLIRAGVKELVLVAQDTTDYGGDLIPAVNLNHLLLQLSDLSEAIWIRFLYGHPSRLDRSLIQTVAQRDNLCAYFDIPIQHADDRLLKRMGRGYRQRDLYRLFETIRAIAPNAALRTTVMVGFPGETDKDVDTLISFMETIQFDNLGCFTYSDSQDLPSHRLRGRVTEKIAKERRNRVMRCQRELSEKKNEKYLGQTLTVLIEESLEENLFAGRHALQAPEVDGTTYVHLRGAKTRPAPGDFAQVRVIDTLEYDVVSETI